MDEDAIQRLQTSFTFKLRHHALKIMIVRIIQYCHNNHSDLHVNGIIIGVIVKERRVIINLHHFQV